MKKMNYCGLVPHLHRKVIAIHEINHPIGLRLKNLLQRRKWIHITVHNAYGYELGYSVLTHLKNKVKD